MSVQRLLATVVWAGVLGVVVNVEVLLFRLVVGGGIPQSLFLGGSVGVAAITYVYLRRLGRRLDRHGPQRWRLTPRQADPVLPFTLGAFLVTLGLAVSDYWPDWVGAAVGACATTLLSRWWLDRLDRLEASTRSR